MLEGWSTGVLSGVLSAGVLSIEVLWHGILPCGWKVRLLHLLLLPSGWSISWSCITISWGIRVRSGFTGVPSDWKVSVLVLIHYCNLESFNYLCHSLLDLQTAKVSSILYIFCFDINLIFCSFIITSIKLQVPLMM